MTRKHLSGQVSRTSDSPLCTYPATDHDRWRLEVEDGRQVWQYLENDSLLANWPQTDVERYWLKLPLKGKGDHDRPAKTPREAARRGFEFASRLQTDDGHWAGEYGGPMFLIPGLVIAQHICEVPFAEHARIEIIRYLIAKANADGGWGIHIEGPSTVFGTALNYAAIRLLGMSADHPVAKSACKTLHGLGGAVAAPAWGKFWLSVLGVYDWRGMNPVPPELWILPHALPIHPGRMWCHTRMVYLPMSYCYGRRVTCAESEIIRQLRQELYIEDYDTIQWHKHSNNVSPADLYLPHSKLFDACNVALRVYERAAPYVSFLRERAIRETLTQMMMEDKNTEYADLGPVNKVMNMVCMWHAYGPDSEEFKNHVPRLADFLWLTSEGMLMNGTNGTQLWDTAFFVQAMIENGIGHISIEPDTFAASASLVSAQSFIANTQITREVPDAAKCYRYARRGAWPFSTRAQGYTVSDTTAEAMKAMLMLRFDVESTSEDRSPNVEFDFRRLEWTVDVLLGMKNDDGGFASYEPIRGPKWLELFNPAEVFGDIMIEYTYPECTTAVLTGLSKFHRHYPSYRADDIRKCMDSAFKYLVSVQKEDGSFFGSWAICFTYATMFALESFHCMGETYHNSDNVRRACDFLASRQNDDGGWGESYRSCELGKYVQHPEGSQVVNTAWAVLGLMAAGVDAEYGNGAVRRGIQLLMERQLSTGEWAQEGIEGVFNRNCAISYPNYKLIFPAWALARYSNAYQRDLDLNEVVEQLSVN